MSGVSGLFYLQLLFTFTLFSCILAEFFTKKALFAGSNELIQLDLISKLCGSPTPDVWVGVEQLPNYSTMRPKRIYPRAIRDNFSMLVIFLICLLCFYFSTIPNAALDLLDKMLVLDPTKRPTATEALRHYWIKNVDASRVTPLSLPTNQVLLVSLYSLLHILLQDCHELWSKKQRKERKSNVPPPNLLSAPVGSNPVPINRPPIEQRLPQPLLPQPPIQRLPSQGQPRPPPPPHPSQARRKTFFINLKSILSLQLL